MSLRYPTVPTPAEIDRMQRRADAVRKQLERERAELAATEDADDAEQWRLECAGFEAQEAALERRHSRTAEDVDWRAK